jgi:hypothetical protein
MLIRKPAVRNDPILFQKHLPTSAKKCFRVNFIRRYFFQDDECRIPHQQVLAELEAEVENSPSRSNVNSTTTAHAAGALPASNNGSTSMGNSAAQAQVNNAAASSGFRIPSPTPIDNFSVSAAAAFRPPSIGPIYASSSAVGDPGNFTEINFDPATFFESSSMSERTANNNQSGIGIGSAAAPNNNFPLSASYQQAQPSQLNQKRAAAPNGSSHTSLNSRDSNKRAKQDEDGPTKPNTPHESRLFSELQQMGFQDPEEMLRGIRHFSDQDTPVRSDEVMVWIVSQREEAEEARKMDEARARSEQFRQENAARRKQAAEEKLAAAKLPELKNDLFKGSWILEAVESSILEPIIDTESSKAILVDLLDKEKQAKKFYAKGNSNLPEAYFLELCTRLSSDKEKILDEMAKEVSTLQTALYSLSEQQGGVPRIFLEANDRKRAAGGYANESDDDEIEILGCFSAPEPSPPSDNNGDSTARNDGGENGLKDFAPVPSPAERIFEVE